MNDDKKRNKNLDEARRIFFDCDGSSFNLDREYGSEYKKYKVPLGIENQWREQIKTELSSKIKTSKGSDKISYINRLCHILSPIEDKIKFIISHLQTDDLDSFSRLLVCELIKHEKVSLTNFVLIDEVDSALKESINKLLSEPITIDKSYLDSNYLQDYDFSDENIKNRIQKLQINV